MNKMTNNFIRDSMHVFAVDRMGFLTWNLFQRILMCHDKMDSAENVENSADFDVTMLTYFSLPEDDATDSRENHFVGWPHRFPGPHRSSCWMSARPSMPNILPRALTPFLTALPALSMIFGSAAFSSA